MQSELDLLCTKACTDSYKNKVKCVDISTQQLVFETASYEMSHHNHHWINVEGVPYLSVQSAQNAISFFKVDRDTKSFTEDESMSFATPSMWDEIRDVVYD